LSLSASATNSNGSVCFHRLWPQKVFDKLDDLGDNGGKARFWTGHDAPDNCLGLFDIQPNDLLHDIAPWPDAGLKPRRGNIEFEVLMNPNSLERDPIQVYGAIQFK
jgi:hypothetical protein